MEEILFQ